MLTALGAVTAQSRIQVFGAERLASGQNWGESDTNFTPSSPGHDATVIFPANKWSALIGSLPLKGLEGSFTTHIRCRWITELTTIKGANATVQFIDADSHDMPGLSAVPIPVTAGWQDVTVTAKVPKGAVTVRFDIDCGAGAGSLEIADYDLYLDGVDLSSAAVRGTVMPWLNVPGGAAALPQAGPNSAAAEFTASAPYSFDDPAWAKLPSYPISTTTSNKTPLNDVAASFQMAWTPENLFVRYHAHDPILNFKAQSRYSRDCFEFFLMPTGHVAGAGGLVTKEQYTVSRTPEGQTDANVNALTRLVGGGWEAIIKIPLQTEARRIYPFNGLALTFNAAYQDANSLPQEHWLSFSKRDQTNSSWEDPSLYVPLVFATDAQVAYKPFYLGGSDTAYNVQPTFPGRINLVHNSASLANIDLWDRTPEAHLDAYAENGHNCFRIKFTNSSRQRRVLFNMSPFNVLAGETLNVTMDGRDDAGPAGGAPGVSFLSESSWNITGAALTSSGALGPQWSKLSYTLTMPDTARGSLRNGRIMIDFGVRPGSTVEVRDIRVTRRLPADFDALISVPSHYSNFWSAEPNTLDFQFAAGTPAPAKVTAEVQDYFSGKILMSHDWNKNMPAGPSGLSWDVSALPNGFFNVLLKVRDAKGGFLADRELYVSKSVKNTRSNPFSGVFMPNNYDVVAPASIPDTVAMLKGVGEGRAQWADFWLFDTEGNDLPGDKTALLRAFHNAGFETGYSLPRNGTHEIGRDWQPEEMESYYKRFLTPTSGLFSHISFANEANLYGGWFPEPDAREWAIFGRGFYNAVKKYAPGTEPILGSFNDIAISYIKTVATEDSNSFAYPAIGMHLYGIDPNGDAFTSLMKDRHLLDQIHPGWQAWDTESGLVFYTFEGALDLQSKKMPVLLNTGYTSSIYLDGYGLAFPCGDSEPLVPMEAFKNKFYLDSTPVGRVTSADGSTQVYLFRRPDGQGIAAFWNTSHDASTLSLPVHGQGRLLDLFGNSVRVLTPGKNSIALNDRFVRYAQGVDLGTLMKSSTFVAAFKSTHSQPAVDPGDTTRVFLSLPVATKAFNQELTVGQASSLAISLHNDSAAPQTLHLGSSSPDGLQVTFANKGIVFLKPQQTQVVFAQMQAGKTIENQPLSLTGTLNNGLKVLPLVFSVQTTPPIDVSGYTRAVEIANRTGAPAEVSVVATKPEFVFQPGVVKETIASSQSVIAPLQIAPNGNYNSNFNTLNAPVYYSLSVSSSQGTYTKDGRCTLFSPSPDDSGPADFASLPYTAAAEHPGAEPFQADYKLSWAASGLRIIARVRDSSPIQTGLNGYLKDGGDSMIIALDPNNGPAPAAFGANYAEYGFAFSHNAPTSYAWDGHNGLESATPFPEAINKISRDASYIYYDVTIPEKLLFHPNGGNTAGMSIAFENREADGSLQTIELGQGIFPQRDPAKMGLLLGKK